MRSACTSVPRATAARALSVIPSTSAPRTEREYCVASARRDTGNIPCPECVLEGGRDGKGEGKYKQGYRQYSLSRVCVGRGPRWGGGGGSISRDTSNIL